MKLSSAAAIALLLGVCGCSATRTAQSPAETVDIPSSNDSEPLATSASVSHDLLKDHDGESFARFPSNGAVSVRQTSYTQVGGELLLPAVEARAPELLATPQPQANSLDELEQKALGFSPALRQAAARVDALQGKWVQVGLYPNPSIGYMGSEIGNEGKAGQQGGYVSQTFITGGKLHLSREVVGQEIAVAQQQFAAMEQRVLTDVRMAYYEALAAQTRESIANDLVALANKAVKTTEDLRKAEEVGRHVLLQAEVEANSAKIVLRQAQAQRRGAARRIAALIGDSYSEDLRVIGTLDQVDADVGFDETLAAIVSTSPEMAAAIGELARAQAALDRASVQYKPDVDTNVGVQFDNSTNDTIVGVQISIPIPIHDRNQGSIQQAMGEIAVAQQRLQRIEVGLQTRLAPVYADYAAARFQVSEYRDHVLPKAKETFEIVEAAYKAGEIDFLTLLTAQRTYFQAQLAYIEALRQLRLRQTEMKGLLLNSSLEQDP